MVQFERTVSHGKGPNKKLHTYVLNVPQTMDEAVEMFGSVKAVLALALEMYAIKSDTEQRNTHLVTRESTGRKPRLVDVINAA